MRFPLLGLILVFIFGILGSSCTSEFNQALNSDDFEKQYETALTFYDAGKYELSKQLFDRVRGYYRSSNEFENILFKYAYSNFHLGEYVLAGHFFTQFETTYRRSPFKEEASFMSAYSDYKLSGSYRLDQGSNEKAIDKFQTFINNHPDSERVAECNRLMDELRRKMELKALDAANLYYRTGQYKSAIHSYNNFIKDFPSSQDIETVRYNLAKTSYQLAKESTIRKQEERFETAVKYCKAFCKKCKNSDHFKEVSSMEEDSNDKIKILKDR